MNAAMRAPHCKIIRSRTGKYQGLAVHFMKTSPLFAVVGESCNLREADTRVLVSDDEQKVQAS
ncbi:hypothetical protein N7522_001960 [Penicillium canescens]|nr:hypothetical protein N7522_001960 [Penicillium canescens]